MKILGKVTNKHGDMVSVADMGDGTYLTQNHEHAVGMTSRSLTKAWENVDEDVSDLADD